MLVRVRLPSIESAVGAGCDFRPAHQCASWLAGSSVADEGRVRTTPGGYIRLHRGDHVDTFGDALRQLRQAVGLSQQALANRALVSKPLLGLVEIGARRPTAEFALACDEALGTAPLLVTLAAMGDDDVRRRAILKHVGGAATLGAVTGSGGLAELVRTGLLEDVAVDSDWDAVVDDYQHQLTVDGSSRFGASLLAQLMVARQRLVETGTSAEMLRAVASLGQLYGLWLGNTGDLSAAHGWYHTASALAGRAGDPKLTSYVLGRSASRGIYEGWTVKHTLADVDRALELAAGRPWDGALEAYAAQVHLCALTGDAKAGRVAASAMAGVAARAGNSAALARAQFSGAFAECRYGTVETAQAAYDECAELLRVHPLWRAELGVYLGRSMVAHGDVTTGAQVALDALDGLTADVRVIGVAVRDLVSSAPKGVRDTGLDQLRTLADPAPGPWETLR